MKITVTGGTGFVGQHIVRALAARGDSVTVLTRRPDGDAAHRDSAGAVRQAAWDPSRRGDWYSVIDGQDAVVHLAGEQAVGRRWSDEAKRRIEASRVESTSLLVEAIELALVRPRVFVHASGVGYYGAHGDEPLDESAPPGDDFLASLCVRWEAAARRAEPLGVRVVALRLGIVLGRGGGALSELVTPFKMFAGGPIGSGKQMFSWIHADDLVAVALLALDQPLSGPVNAVAPNAVSNEELARTLGRVLGRPSWLRVPAAALRLRFGEGATPLLTGQRAVPAALQARGHSFRYPTLSDALVEALA